MSKEFKKVWGIDLGTTYSCIACVDEFGRPTVAKNKDNQLTTPSVVFFDEGNERIVGQVAKANAKIYPDAVAAFVKRAMGDAEYRFYHKDTPYRAEEISAMIVKKLVQDAAETTGESITDVVITCPAYFGSNEKEATKVAGEIAGLNVRGILPEPTAAAIAYGMAEGEERKVVLVYDLGGGTFDVTMIEITPDKFEVICTGGDRYLGGKDWDDAIVTYLVTEYQQQTGTSDDPLDDPETTQELLLVAEQAKMTLTERQKQPLSFSYKQKVRLEFTREKFEEITSHLLERTIVLTKQMLEEARKKGYESFDKILLVGGSTRMPQVKARVEKEFAVPVESFDPDEAVAKGAAIYGYKLAINDTLVKRVAAVTGQSVDNVDMGHVDQKIIQQAEQQLANDIGLTITAVKSARKVKIVNVVSKSFGVIAQDRETKQEKVCNLILKNTNLPVSVTQQFGTAEDDQENVFVQIMENESTETYLEVSNAAKIGDATLELPAGLPAGAPIEIMFEFNEGGLLSVTAVELKNNDKIETTIQTNSVIQGEELAEAKKRSNAMVIS